MFVARGFRCKYINILKFVNFEFTIIIYNLSIPSKPLIQWIAFKGNLIKLKRRQHFLEGESTKCIQTFKSRVDMSMLSHTLDGNRAENEIFFFVVSRGDQSQCVTAIFVVRHFSVCSVFAISPSLRFAACGCCYCCFPLRLLCALCWFRFAHRTHIPCLVWFFPN